MKLYIFPPSARALGIVALKNYLMLDCEVQAIDLGCGDQHTPQYLALNPNKKMPTLEDKGFVLWECFTWRPSTPTANSGPPI
jgi:glutathione S-transferase